jgi:hypothetical protein
MRPGSALATLLLVRAGDGELDELLVRAPRELSCDLEATPAEAIGFGL